MRFGAIVIVAAACAGTPARMPDANNADSATPDTHTSTVAQIAYVKASNTNAADTFGQAVALSGDGNTLAIAAPLEDSDADGFAGDETNNATQAAGAVYLWTRTGQTTFRQDLYIKAAHSDASDTFGASLAVSTDGTTLAVGAMSEASNATGIDGNQLDNSDLGNGAAYVFVKSGSTWSQQAYVKASRRSGYFGGSIALSSDGNTLAVGAPAEAGSTGVVYVFVRQGTMWAQQSLLPASNADVNDLFGFSIALSGDGNTLAVGAIHEASGATGVGGNQADNSKGSSGAVYVFSRAGTTWSQEAYVKASTTNIGDLFGSSVALTANGNLLAVGMDGPGATVSLFSRTGSTWTPTSKLGPPAFAARGQVALSAVGDVIVIGSSSDRSGAAGVDGDPADTSKPNSGAAHVFSLASSPATRIAYIKASNPDSNDLFGLGLALSADASLLAVGAMQEDSAATGIAGDQMDNSASDSGAVYLFH